ncbi:hypothetical protein CRENBAI_006493 [Crenichthys baileyi]|uniref:Uncharacterized protein n=1 Tax=Crenichthys baileyi TaxID=28760 RepID=A0AAV9QRE5_9TELE
MASNLMSLSSRRAAHKVALPSILCLFATASPTLNALLAHSLSTERCASPQLVCDTDVFLRRDVYPAGKHLETEKSPSKSRRQGLLCSQGLLTKCEEDSSLVNRRLFFYGPSELSRICYGELFDELRASRQRAIEALAPYSPQSSCHYVPPPNEPSPYGRLLSQGRIALIKPCEEPRVTGDKFYWELTYKNEGAMQSQILPDGMEGLNYNEMAKMDGKRRPFLYAAPRLYPRELS